MIKGRNIDKNTFVARTGTLIDLSGIASAETILLHPTNDVLINSVSICFLEASSADAGSAINLGNVSSATTFGAITTAVSKAAESVQTVEGTNLTTDVIPAGTGLIVASAGGKTGTGTCYVCVNYTVL